MSHMNFKMVGTITKEGGWADIREFKREHLIDTPAYVDDAGLLVPVSYTHLTLPTILLV